VGDSNTIRVVGAIIERDGEVFAARRNPERSAGGLWEFPGGKIEVDETPEQALRRELHEELDIDTSIGQLLDQSIGEVDGATIELSCYEAVLHGPDPSISTDHDALTWVALDQLGELEWAPGDVPIIERLPVVLAARRTARDGAQ
jgi:8-oxo-dGTP diphosphatase